MTETLTVMEQQANKYQQNIRPILDNTGSGDFGYLFNQARLKEQLGTQPVTIFLLDGTGSTQDDHIDEMAIKLRQAGVLAYWFGDGYGYNGEPVLDYGHSTRIKGRGNGSESSPISLAAVLLLYGRPIPGLHSPKGIIEAAIGKEFDENGLIRERGVFYDVESTGENERLVNPNQEEHIRSLSSLVDSMLPAFNLKGKTSEEEALYLELIRQRLEAGAPLRVVIITDEYGGMELPPTTLNELIRLSSLGNFSERHNKTVQTTYPWIDVLKRYLSDPSNNVNLIVASPKKNDLINASVNYEREYGMAALGLYWHAVCRLIGANYVELPQDLKQLDFTDLTQLPQFQKLLVEEPRENLLMLTDGK